MSVFHPFATFQSNVRLRPIADIENFPQHGRMVSWMDGIKAVRKWWTSRLDFPHHVIPSDIRERLPLADIQKVTFYKLDELTTDLICCEVESRGQVWFFHEEAEGWEGFVTYLAELPGFRSDWYQAVVQPPFATSETVAYTRAQEEG